MEFQKKSKGVGVSLEVGGLGRRLPPAINVAVDAIAAEPRRTVTSCWNFWLDLTWRIVGDFVGLDLPLRISREVFLVGFAKFFGDFLDSSATSTRLASIYSGYFGLSYFGCFERNKVTLKSGLP